MSLNIAIFSTRIFVIKRSHIEADFVFSIAWCSTLRGKLTTACRVYFRLPTQSASSWQLLITLCGERLSDLLNSICDVFNAHLPKSCWLNGLLFTEWPSPRHAEVTVSLGSTTTRSHSNRHMPRFHQVRGSHDFKSQSVYCISIWNSVLFYFKISMSNITCHNKFIWIYVYNMFFSVNT